MNALQINNPDKRVEILKKYALDRSHFAQETPLLDFAIKVESITTSKKPNLILNVDGAIGAIFVDILRNSGCFTPQEAQEAVEIGALNGLFVLGRSMGFIGESERCKQKAIHPVFRPLPRPESAAGKSNLIIIWRAIAKI